MKNIFAAQQLKSHSNSSDTEDARSFAVISAEGAHAEINKKTGDRFIVATNGYRYQGQAGQKNFEIIKYDSYGVRMDTQSVTGRHEGTEAIPTLNLFKNALENKSYMAELQWRLSMPFSVLVLVLLAVPLSQVKPRQGRFVQLLPGVLLYICYANLMLLGKSWLEDGKISLWLGLWWIHLSFLLIALWFHFTSYKRS